MIEAEAAKAQEQENIPKAESRSGMKQEFIDFTRSFLHTAIASSLNGISQVLGRSTGLELPELEIFIEPESDSLGTKIGHASGLIANFYLFSHLAKFGLGKIGGAGIAGSTLRAGIAGGVYTGLFQATDVRSNDFWKERLSNAAVGALTFSAHAFSMQGLSQSGLLRHTENRRFFESVLLGAVSGASAGAVHSQSKAFFKDGKKFPQATDFAKDILSFSFAGASAGAFEHTSQFLFKLNPDSIRNPLPSDTKNQ